MRQIPDHLKQGYVAEVITDEDDLSSLVEKFDNGYYIIDNRKNPEIPLYFAYVLAKKKLEPPKEPEPEPEPQPEKKKHRFF